ncbi:carbon monoxide dehydrogenase [Streptomyces sp. NBC_00053]|uniref:carbon monoxide dehydrogenase n=1 Tax=unclassified Streptomyces TaxID=2593676 RepID=UPI000FA1AD12|nr:MULTISPECIES: carbon monoxide dehydrogenase [unclassified Streptomyces]WSG51717.1 carbon monoxide dehydrogenase [Streptomyces sp. NBC_01732]WSX02373.1 carbon monoxide dehydrogenase [Streptomyces sp. NBC_00987]MCX5101667.1 carbon monoxide dehydrogenase [Streptomyces sp. NBC_00439]MCX5161191.1 carbon monoxide dehydrogenase [Streptomyces sp. NBC_00305]MCX5219714.1 carbon monoxide dehydrogenase [Streptomyces sp. NBC_00264]
MEHEVFVPVPVPSLRRTLGDPARVARCVPGLQQDADASAGPLSGRLRIRVDGHTITYRGALRLTDAPQDGPEGAPGAGVLVTGEGAEARGGGSVKLSLTIGLTERDGGTAIGFTGTASGDGRLLELDAAAVLAAAHRLLDRFAQQLVTETLATGGEPDGPLGEAVEQAIEEAAEEADTTGAATAHDAVPEAGGTGGTDDVPPTHDATADEAPAAGGPEVPGNPPGTGSVFDAPVPPPSLDPASEAEFTTPEDLPAEAAHARRTMIGRSAEEVDHAPPRGRYAPVPSPDSTTAGATLRWVAPAAALALASAVVVTRALRRRR